MGRSKLMTRDWPTSTLIWTGSSDAFSNEAGTKFGCRPSCARAAAAPTESTPTSTKIFATRERFCMTVLTPLLKG